MDVTQIMQVLPHRYPLLLVDKILEFDRKEWIVGVKNLTATEPVFQGHFPDNPIMPGVYQLEAMAQVAGILVNTLAEAEGEVSFFLAVDHARFRKVLRPGDTMRIEVKLLRARMHMYRLAGKVLVDDEVACEAELLLGRKG